MNKVIAGALLVFAGFLTGIASTTPDTHLAIYLSIVMCIVEATRFLCKE